MKTKIMLVIWAIFSGTIFIKDSSAITFRSGDYEIRTFSFYPGEGEINDIQCRTVNKVGWKIFNDPGCELLSENTVGNTQTWDIKCDGLGVDNLSVSITFLEDSFDGTGSWREKNSKTESKERFIGKRVSSCSDIRAKSGPLESHERLKAYVKEKYQNIKGVEFDVKHTADGPYGKLHISGNMPLQHKESIDLDADLDVEPDRYARVRALANAFLDDELSLLGLNNLDEIREYKIDYATVFYRRYINNVEVANSDIEISIGPNEQMNIADFKANLIPVPAEVYEATKKKTLSEEDIKSIVESELKIIKANTTGYTPMAPKKLAIIQPPYVIWKVSYYWDQTFDAFTGEVLIKHRNVVY